MPGLSGSSKDSGEAIPVTGKGYAPGSRKTQPKITGEKVTGKEFSSGAAAAAGLLKRFVLRPDVHPPLLWSTVKAFKYSNKFIFLWE